MPQLIELKNGEYVSLTCFEDALEAVEANCGRGLRDYLEEYLQDNVDDAVIERLETEKEMKDQKECGKALILVRNGLETLMEKLDEEYPDNADLKNLVTAICAGMENEL